MYLIDWINLRLAKEYNLNIEWVRNLKDLYKEQKYANQGRLLTRMLGSIDENVILSTDEWEVVSLYCAFSFVKETKNTSKKRCYEEASEQ